MAQVFKIKFQGTLRRWTVPIEQHKPDAESAFSDLDARVRELFNIPSTAQLQITYTDADNDVITMANDQDYRDACVMQQLNPLRLEVQVLASTELVEYAGPSLAMSEIPSEGFFERVPSREAAKFKPCDMYKHGSPQPASKRWFFFGRSEKPSTELVEYAGPSLAMSEIPSEGFFQRVPSREAAKFKPCDMYKHGSPQPASKRWFFFGRSEKPSPIIHHRVRCDHCGMTPIKGPRYKSLEKHDYDLCSSCFMEIGDETFYCKMDTPIMMNKDQHHFYLESRMVSDGTSHKLAEKASGNLDSVFVQDLGIGGDGTILAPGTSFSKVWRMRNVGSLPWPHQTKLVPNMGGGILSFDKHVTLELPEAGLPCGTDIDVSVDLTAPEKIGCYVGRWCLMAPTGETFGQSVWVVIQVAAQGEQSCDQVHSKEADTKGEHVPKPERKKLGSTAGQVVNLSEQKDAEDGDKLNGFSVMEQYHIDNATGSSNVDTSTAVELLCSEPAFERVPNEVIQEIALKTCGLNLGENNTPIMQNIDSNLQKTIDNLVTSAGWDPMLKDLQEMGFHDMQLNRRMLFKNNGSIKHVVRDLVDMEKQLPNSGAGASRRQLD